MKLIKHTHDVLHRSNAQRRIAERESLQFGHFRRLVNVGHIARSTSSAMPGAGCFNTEDTGTGRFNACY